MSNSISKIKQNHKPAKKQAFGKLEELPVDLSKTLTKEEESTVSTVSGGGGIAFPDLGKKGSMLGLLFG